MSFAFTCGRYSNLLIASGYEINAKPVPLLTTFDISSICILCAKLPKIPKIVIPAIKLVNVSNDVTIITSLKTRSVLEKLCYKDWIRDFTWISFMIIYNFYFSKFFMNNLRNYAVFFIFENQSKLSKHIKLVTCQKVFFLVNNSRFYVQKNNWQFALK